MSFAKIQARAVIDALRRGTVPMRGLQQLAIGLSGFEKTLAEELDSVRSGAAQFKALRGEYGSGKTFFSRWFQEVAQTKNFVTSEIQISETETPLHRLETVYRRLMEHLTTEAHDRGAFRGILDAWLYDVEEQVLAQGWQENQPGYGETVGETIEKRLTTISQVAPSFSACLRGYHRAGLQEEAEIAEGLSSWLAGQPNVAASAKRFAHLKGDIDHFGALGFLQGLLALLKDLGYAGLVLILDEVETLQRFRRDSREKSLNALRQWLDDLDGGRFPNLYLMITGTQAFFEGPKGVKSLAPLAQRLHVDFLANARFDNPRATQIRLQGFDFERLLAVGKRALSVYLKACEHPQRVAAQADDALLEALARGVVGEIGGVAGIAPRTFLKKWIGEVLDRLDQFEDFDPWRDYPLIADQRGDDGKPRVQPQKADDIDLDL